MYQNINRSVNSIRYIIFSVFLVSAFLVLSLLIVKISIAAQMDILAKFPSKPITIMVGASAGGSLDKEARAIAPFLEKEFKVSVKIENVVGAGGIIAYNKFHKEKPDGHTILYFNISSALALELTRNESKFIVKNFSPIAAYANHNFLFVSGTSNTFNEFLNEAKKRTISVAVIGGSGDVQTRLFEDDLGIKLTWVPYGSGNEALMAIAGKHVEIALSNPVSCMSMLKAGKLKGLALFSETPDPFLPGVPTLKQLGRDDVTIVRQTGVFAAPPDTPKEITAILEKGVRNAIVAPEATKIYKNGYIDIDFKPSTEVNKLILETYTLIDRYKQAIK